MIMYLYIFLKNCLIKNIFFIQYLNLKIYKLIYYASLMLIYQKLYDSIQ